MLEREPIRTVQPLARGLSATRRPVWPEAPITTTGLSGGPEGVLKPATWSSSMI
jgi:hypothetical protein